MRHDGEAVTLLAADCKNVSQISTPLEFHSERRFERLILPRNIWVQGLMLTWERVLCSVLCNNFTLLTLKLVAYNQHRSVMLMQGSVLDITVDTLTCLPRSGRYSSCRLVRGNWQVQFIKF